MSCIRTDCLLPNNFQILAFQHFAEHPTSLLLHTNPCTPFTNWLIEPSYHPLPMCAQFVSFNSYRNSRAETKLSLFPLFINGGKNSSPVFETETKTAKWTQSPKRRTERIYL